MLSFFFFFFNDTATTEIYTLSLHDALPICAHAGAGARARHRRILDPDESRGRAGRRDPAVEGQGGRAQDRKSTRLNSSHGYISYAVFCLKKKKHIHTT